MIKALQGRNMHLVPGEMEQLRNVKHRIEFWHKATKVKSSLSHASRKVANADLRRWVNPIHNHFWRAGQMCGGDARVFKVCLVGLLQ